MTDFSQGKAQGRIMGYVHIYCGDGKGKTTAAVGQAVRMAGSGGRAVIVRFLKNDDSGEVEALKQVSGITVIPCRRTFGFTWQMSGEERTEAAAFYTALFREAAELAFTYAAKGQTLLVLDEVCAAVGSGLLDRGQVIECLDHRPEALEIVMTGRNPAEEFTARADYISEIRKVRHPFDRGIPARKGIEY